MNRQLAQNNPFPFYQYKFFPDHRFQLYGLLSHQGASNEYYHYFIRQREQFHYIGALPFLIYDEELKLFLAQEKDALDRKSYFYQLKENKFYPVKKPKEIK